MNLRALALGLLLIGACPHVAEARAWTRKVGEGTIRLSYGYLGADKYYGVDGETIDIPDYRQHTVNLFAEVGVIERWLTLSLEGEAYRSNLLDGQGSSNGIGDFRVGAWTGLVATGGFRLTGGLLFGLNLGDDDESIARVIPPGVPAGVAEPLPPGVLPELPNGDGEFDVEARIVFGSDLRWLPAGYPLEHFVELELGVVWHTDQDEAVTFGFKAGTKVPVGVLRRVWWIVSIYGVASFASEREVEPILTGVGNGVSFVAISFEAAVDLVAGLEAFVRLDGALRARALPAGAVINVGLGYTF